MQLVWILLIAAAITACEIFIYHYHLPRFFLFIFPMINICLEICIIFYILRLQALVSSSFPLWIRIGVYLLPLLISLFMMTGLIVRRYVKMEHKKPVRHIVYRLFAFFLISMLLIFLATVYFAQEYVIFYPNVNSQDRDELMKDTDYERIRINSHYYGWLKRAEDTDNMTAQSPLIVYFGGNAQNTSTLFKNYDEIGIFTYMKNISFLSIDYPSYGDSEGSLSQEELFTMADEVLEYVQHQFPNKKLYIIGYSIGTGIAAYAASVAEPDALILLSPYNNGRDLFNSYFPVFYGPFQYLIRYPLTSDAYVSTLTCRSMVILSDKDTIVRPKLTERLIACFPKAPTVIHYDTLDHGDIAMKKEVWKTIIEYLEVQSTHKLP